MIGFANTEGKLMPGMTANVRVVTDERRDVRKLPNGALRMRIAGAEPAVAARPPASAAPSAGAQTVPLAAEEGGRSGTPGRVYVLDAKGRPKAVPVRLGVSDGSMTELLPGGATDVELAEGAEVIVGSKPAGGGNGAKPGGGPRPPF